MRPEPPPTSDQGLRDLWEQNAGWWQSGFTGGADPEYVEQILPLTAEHLTGSTRVLDVGTGEGQLARIAGQVGAGVTVGLDASVSQLRKAVDLGGSVLYVRGDVRALAFRGGAFDAVVACLVLEHVDSLERAIEEVARVLAPRGRFLLFANHPLLQAPGSGWIDDRVLEEQYWRIGPYLDEDTTMEEVDKGVFIPFVHRPLSRYLNALSNCGMFVTRMEEPAPPPGFLAKAREYRDAAKIPRLLLLRAEKLPA